MITNGFYDSLADVSGPKMALHEIMQCHHGYQKCEACESHDKANENFRNGFDEWSADYCQRGHC